MNCSECGKKLPVDNVQPLNFGGLNFRPPIICDECGQRQAEKEQREIEESLKRTCLMHAAKNGFPDKCTSFSPKKGNMTLLKESEQFAGRSVFVHGDSGRCKSRVLAFRGAQMFKPYVQRHKAVVPIYYHLSLTLFDILRTCASDYSQMSKLTDKYKKADLLIIDDLGARPDKESAFVVDHLFEILEARQMSERVTWLSSNYGIDETCCRISPDRGKFFARRLHDYCTIIQA